jgi:ribose transport system ATP-binding protein
MTTPLLSMTDISKSFGSIQALRHVDFQLRAGEIMALVGENGAGKSTLVKILTGIYRPDSGAIRIGDKQVHIRRTADSQAQGIAVVQQELSLVPTMSIAENVFLGNKSLNIVMSQRKLADIAAPYLELVGLDYLDPSTTVSTLLIAERQLIEIARMVARQACILILDEPTAALDDSEIDRVKRVVRTLAKQGNSIIYVTHHLAEVFDLADRVTVFRNGEGQPGIPVSELTPEALIERMIGRSIQRMFPPRATDFGAEVLTVHEMRTELLVSPVDLSVRSGEILGLAGQLGSGAAGLLYAIAGVQPIFDGRIDLNGKRLNIQGRRDAISAGVAYCSADRKKDGLFGIRTVTENLTAPSLDRVTSCGWLNKRTEKLHATRLAHSFLIDENRLGYPAETLSGGNQQKVALGKWMGIQPEVFLVEEPTVGVDVGARADIYSHLRRMADQGLAIIFASSDIHEVLGLADTIATFYHGRLINTYPAKETDLTRLTMDVTSPSHEVNAAL